MSSVNVSNIILILQQKINASTNETDLLYYSKAMQQLRTGQVFAVDAVTNLPNPTLSLGYLYYVIADELVYFASSLGWVPIYSSSANAIFSWGDNATFTAQCAQLGDGTLTNRCSPVREFCSATDWCQVSAGAYHTAAVKTTGQIWAWGTNSAGQLGDGTPTIRCSPVRERSSATNWCQVTTGQYHTAAINTSGQLWAWGCNACGRIGDGTTTVRCSPVREFCSATDWCQVSSGVNSNAAIKTTGQIWAWGRNNCGQIGDGTTTDRCSPVREFCSATDWCRVSSGGGHTAAIKTSGQIWTWGTNPAGQLGDNTAVSKCSPIREISSSTDWCSIGAGYRRTFGIKTSGQLWGWGSNVCGSLGFGLAGNTQSPVREFCSATDWCQVSTSIVRYHTTAIKTSGQLWAWGNNTRGQLADGTTTSRCSPVREICSATDWCQVSAGGCHTSAIISRNL